ncbi:MAG: hypothetical protein OXG37_14625 [Actinomycetia bacterium]|nr:hypothetical protein [Actinomycetes bacterium]
MERHVIERARSRVRSLRASNPDVPELSGVLEQARSELAELAEVAAELQSTIPEQLRSAIQEATRREILPVARYLAEVRGLTAQQTRRLERIQETLDAERHARIADLEVLVDLLAASWEGLDARLDALGERLGRLERPELREAPAAEGLELHEAPAAQVERLSSTA